MQYLTMLLVLALVALLVAQARDLPTLVRTHRDELLAAAAVTAIGLFFRLGLATGPMDLYWRLGDALEPLSRAESEYGLAFPTVIRMLWWLTGPTDSAVFALNTAAGTLCVAAAWALARQLGAGVPGAALTAVGIALGPSLAHFSRTDNQSVLEIALTLWGLFALVRSRDVLDRLTASLALSLAATLRPEAAIVLVVGLTALPLREQRPSRTDAWLLVGPALVLPAGLATLAVARVSDMTGAFREPRAFWSGLDHPLFLDFTWTPVWVPVAMLACLVARRVSPGARLWALGWALALTWYVWGWSYAEMHMAAMRHQLRALPFVVLAAGIGLEALLDRVADRSMRMAASLALILGVAALPAVSAAWRPPTITLEYQVVRQAMPDLPERCRMVAHFNPEGVDLALIPPIRLSWMGKRRHAWIDLAHGALPEEGCVLYYRGSNCFARAPGQVPSLPTGSDRVPVRPECAADEAGLTLLPLHTALVPGRTFGTDYYPPGGLLEIGFFAIEGRSATSDPIHVPLPAPVSPQDSPRFAAELPDRAPEIRADWPAEAILEALRSDPTCPVAAELCRDGVCVIASDAPACTRKRCGEPASELGGPASMQLSWEAGSRRTCTVVPTDDPGLRAMQTATWISERLLADGLGP